MYRPVNHGYIEVVVGPMYSGKSEELIRRLKRAKIAKQNITMVYWSIHIFEPPKLLSKVIIYNILKLCIS